jgi:hypothetical protein
MDELPQPSGSGKRGRFSDGGTGGAKEGEQTGGHSQPWVSIMKRRCVIGSRERARRKKINRENLWADVSLHLCTGCKLIERDTPYMISRTVLNVYALADL